MRQPAMLPAAVDGSCAAALHNSDDYVVTDETSFGVIRTNTLSRKNKKSAFSKITK